MCLNMSSEPQTQSPGSLEHSIAVPLCAGYVDNCRWAVDLVEVLAHIAAPQRIYRCNRIRLWIHCALLKNMCCADMLMQEDSSSGLFD